MDTTTNNNQFQTKIQSLRQAIQNPDIPEDVRKKLEEEVMRVEWAYKANQFGPETDKLISYIEFVLSLPWNKTSKDILDLNRAKQILDQNHYGLESIKERILEYLSILILNDQKGQQARQPVLMFVGLVGSGKTTLAYSIAESLGRPIIRIPFGGLASALQLRGESRVKSEAEAGMIMKAIARSGVKNPVILLDELDRVAEEQRHDIMGVLVELLDTSQNSQFLDHYLNFPFDLSQVLFVGTANNTANIVTAVMDRMEVVEMPFYTDDQKVVIAQKYLMPEALKNAGLDPNIIQIDQSLWPTVVRPLGFDGGIRSLKRNVDTLVRKVAKKVVEGNHGPFVISETNVKEYMPS